MITVCDGNWSKHLTHKRVTIKDNGTPEGGISHGMCERCSLLLEAEIDGVSGQKLIDYANYLASPLDPRD